MVFIYHRLNAKYQGSNSASYSFVESIIVNESIRKIAGREMIFPGWQSNAKWIGNSFTKPFDMKLLYYCILISIFCFCSSSCTTKTDQLVLFELKTEGLVNPLGIDAELPGLSWQLFSDQQGQKQTAYRILVASSTDLLQKGEADLWDSGKVLSDQSIHVVYQGSPLVSEMKCFWKVMVWDIDGIPSHWSETAFWTMGLLNETDWQAKWIGVERALGNDQPFAEKTKLAARYLRNEFTIDKEVDEAYVYMCGLGLSELNINNQKVGDHVLSPGQTQFNKRVLYVTHDVSRELMKGDNAIGVILGNGRYFKMRFQEPMFTELHGYPKLIFQLRVKFSDGTDTLIVSDEHWKLSADGPIYENNEFDGEKYDARKEQKGWSSSNFDDTGWLQADVLEQPAAKLSAQMNEPIRVTESIKPIEVTEIQPGQYVFDIGQNIAGWVRLRVSAERGDSIGLRFAETLQPDGSLYRENLRTAEATDVYICKGEGLETWEPRFAYHGFRYVELSGYKGKPDLSTIEAKVVHDDLTETGTFQCSNSTINQIYNNAVWGIRGNYRSFPTDSPQRDERAPWLGDRATGSRGESFVFDISKLYAKWMRDIEDTQLEWGSISDICPSYTALYNDNVAWEGTPVLLANMLYEQYGNQDIISKSYPFLRKWYRHMADNYLKNGLIPRSTYGDWCMPPTSPEQIHSTDKNRITRANYLGTSYFYHISCLMEGFSEMLDLPDDQTYFRKNAAEIKAAIHASFFNELDSTYSNNTATASILALAFDLVPEVYKDKVVKNLIEKIEVQHKGQIPVGVIGSQFLMRTLTQQGMGGLAYRFATQTDYPSWGYMLEQGATTIWELWNGNTADPAMNSCNHVMLLGDFVTWLYSDLAGIQPEKPGYKTVRFQPFLMEELDYVDASYHSPYGKIVSSWKILNGIFQWEIEVPVNSNALVYIPATNEHAVEINGKALDKIKAVQVERQMDGYLVVSIESGKYSISSSEFSVQESEMNRVSLPDIIADQTQSDKVISVKLACDMEDVEIRYTIDGSEPNEYSELYRSELSISATCILKVRGFKKGLEPSYTVSKTFDIINPSLNRLHYSYYEGKWQKLPDFSKLKPKAQGTTGTIGDFSSISQRADYWAVLYTGKLKVDHSGLYFFELNSDDGSRLYLNDELVIDNDGIHGESEAKGSIHLEEGMHDIRIEYFEGNYDELLELTYGRSGWPMQSIPQSMLYLN